jgi:hypothetical protein
MPFEEGLRATNRGRGGPPRFASGSPAFPKPPQIRLTEVSFNSAAGSVAFQQPITYAKAAPSENMIAVAFDDSGRERLPGEYTFNHTRTLPGPGTC